MNSSIFVFVITFIITSAQRSTVFEDCSPGDTLPGPTCTTFYRCVEGRHINRKVRFNCPPGTSFYEGSGMCNYIASDCDSDSAVALPRPPAPQGFIGVGSTTNGLPPGLPTGVTSSPGAPQCRQYEVDPEGVYDCPSPGVFPSHGDCSTFYTCINTMACVVKGFYVKCPRNYLFSHSRKICLPVEATAKCDIFLDDQIIEIQPVIQLEENSISEFFSASAYWRFMRYVPSERQRIIRIPGHHSRNSGSNFVMKNA